MFNYKYLGYEQKQEHFSPGSVTCIDYHGEWKSGTTPPIAACFFLPLLDQKRQDYDSFA
jgi:hypothetical protein